MRDVADTLIAKMRARHPHLYGDGEKVAWERMKAKARTSIADGLPVDLPALHRAHRLQDRAAGVGFDWPDAQGPAEKVEEELREVRGELIAHPDESMTESAGRVDRLEDELGDLLFAAVNLCRKAGVHASVALDRANLKFTRRFEAVEGLAAARGIEVKSAGLAVLDGLWDEVKGSGE